MKHKPIQNQICSFCKQPCQNPYYCPTCDAAAPYRVFFTRASFDRRFSPRPIRRLKGRP